MKDPLATENCGSKSEDFFLLQPNCHFTRTGTDIHSIIHFRVPQDIDMSNRFQESAGSWSDPQAVPPVPPIPPRNYNSTSCNANMYSGNYNTMQPYYQRPYGGNYSMGMNGMNMNSYMYRNSYMNHGYPPQDNYFMPGG